MRISFCLLIVIFFASSCSQKFSLQKRRYNKGFYFSGTHSPKKQADNPATADIPKPSDEVVVTEEAEVIAKTDAYTKENGPEKKEVVSEPKNPEQVRPVSPEQPSEEFTDASPAASSHNKSSFESQSANSDGDFLLMVLLVGLGGTLGAVLVFLYLLLFYPLIQAILIFLAVILVVSLLGGGLYFGIGF